MTGYILLIEFGGKVVVFSLLGNEKYSEVGDRWGVGHPIGQGLIVSAFIHA